MKTPDEIKKGLWCCCGQYSDSCGKCPYSNNGKDCGTNGVQIMKDAFAFIQQLEASYSQVSKALCGNENATLEELLQAVSRVKSELALAVLQRDAAVDALGKSHPCESCTHFDCQWDEPPCSSCIHSDPVDNFTSNFEWRGVCQETEVQEDEKG